MANLPYFSLMLVAVAMFSLLALLGEHLAYSQTRREQYRVIHFVNALRRCRYLAYAAGVMAVALALVEAKQPTLLGLSFGFIAAGMLSLKDVLNGHFTLALRGTVAPVMLGVLALCHVFEAGFSAQASHLVALLSSAGLVASAALYLGYLRNVDRELALLLS